MLRRLKQEVVKLPDKIEWVVKCEMSAYQRRLYCLILDHRSVPSLSSKRGFKRLNNTDMHLRKVCNHPYLLLDEDYVEDEDLVRTSGKFDLLDRMLPKFKATNHKVLIFSQMTNLLRVLGQYLAMRGYRFLEIVGDTKDRQVLIDEFNKADSIYDVFMLSTKAGGLVTNLQTADTVIIFDSDWNPQGDVQAQDRAHRIGQRNEVRVFRFVTKHSIEERMLQRASHKLDIDKKVIQAGMFNNQSSDLERTEQLVGSRCTRVKV